MWSFRKREEIKPDFKIFVLSNWKDGIASRIGENLVDQVKEASQKLSLKMLRLR